MYNPATSDYDVGVINIPGGIALNGYSTRAISLPARGTVIPNDTNILVTGWGDTTVSLLNRLKFNELSGTYQT